jgi:hypothetical protein
MSDLIERLISRADFFDSLREWDAPSGALEREAADRIAGLEKALAEARERYVAFRQILVETLDTSPPTEGAMEFVSRLTDRMEHEADKFDAASLSSSKQKDSE